MSHPIDTDVTPMQGFPAMWIGFISSCVVRSFIPWVLSVPLTALRASGDCLAEPATNHWASIWVDAAQTGLLSMECSTSNIVKKSS